MDRCRVEFISGEIDMKTDLKDIKCPKCQITMIADIHAPEDGAHWVKDHEGKEPIPRNELSSKEEMRKMDNWYCIGCEKLYEAEELGVEYG